jgi:hypothetical protein
MPASERSNGLRAFPVTPSAPTNSALPPSSGQTVPGWPPARRRQPVKLPHPGHRLLPQPCRWPAPCANPTASSSKPSCASSATPSPSSRTWSIHTALPASTTRSSALWPSCGNATQRRHEPLTVDRLFGWHAALFPTDYSGLAKIRVGQWRDGAQGPMQVVSGPIHRQKVHYEAPAAHLLDAEMVDSLHWFNADQRDDPVVKAGLAHLWFVTLHPFEDGDGRIAQRWDFDCGNQPYSLRVLNTRCSRCPSSSAWLSS